MKKKGLQTQRRDLWLPRVGVTGRGIGWYLGISKCKLLYIEWINNMSYCIAQGTRFNIMWQIIMEQNMKKCVCVYMCVCVCVYVYNWIILLYSRNEYNIINQLYINKIIFCKKKKKRKNVMVTKGNKKSSPISRHLQRSQLFGVKQLHIQDLTV